MYPATFALNVAKKLGANEWGEASLLELAMFKFKPEFMRVREKLLIGLIRPDKDWSTFRAKIIPEVDNKGNISFKSIVRFW